MSRSGADRLLEQKREKVRAISNRHLRGVPLFDVGDEDSISKLSPPFPIEWCLCVQDSPENPCPCKGLVLWLPTFPRAVRKTGTRSSDDEAIYDFELDPDAEVIVELQMSIPLRSLERLRMAALRRKSAYVIGGSKRDASGDRTPDVLYSKKKGGWAGVAYSIGYAVGTLLDDFLGSEEGGNDKLSDDISDWAADNWPAPDWLTDLF